MKYLGIKPFFMFLTAGVLVLASMSFAGLGQGKEHTDPSQWRHSETEARHEREERAPRDPRRETPSQQHDKKGRGTGDRREYDSELHSKENHQRNCSSSKARRMRRGGSVEKMERAMRAARDPSRTEKNAKAKNRRDIEEQMQVELDYDESEEGASGCDEEEEIEAEEEGAAAAYAGDEASEEDAHLFRVDINDRDQFPALPFAMSSFHSF